MLLTGPVSQTSIQYMDFVKISLDLSAIYIANFSGCLLGFLVSSCYFILERSNLLSGVK